MIRKDNFVKKVFVRIFWVLGFLPLPVGGLICWDLYHPKTGMDIIGAIIVYYFIIAIAIFSCVLTLILVPCLIVLSIKISKKSEYTLPRKKERIIITASIIIIAAIFLGIATPLLIPYVNGYIVRQEYIAKGIYEVGDTFMLNSRDGYNENAIVYYMVCKPPSGRDQLKSMVDNYIKSNNIVEKLKARGNGKITGELELDFVKPTKAFPIGWNSGYEEGNYLDKHWLDSDNNSILTVFMPVNAKSEDEYTYVF